MGFKPTADSTPADASTSVYVERNGVRYAVFHRGKRSATSWQHDYTQAASDSCSACAGRPVSSPSRAPLARRERRV